MNRLTLEQQEIVEHYGNAVVNACAGAGKSSTARAYAKARPKEKILYLAYNSSVKKEAIHKFASMENVTVETGHSLAYKALDVGRKFTLRDQNNLSVTEVVERFNLEPDEENSHYVLARHIINHFNKFLNSGHNWPDELRYLREITDIEARAFVGKHRDRIIDGSTRLFELMRDNKIPITHDFYLKAYQLQKPKLHFDSIIIDEGQDSNPPVMDIFLNQKGHLLLIGDEYQSVYSWRGAVDALSLMEEKGFGRFFLTGSFRFDQNIANLGMRALRLREWIGFSSPQYAIRGLGGTTTNDTEAFIARSNLSLLEMAINQAKAYPDRKFCFEGGFSNYSFNSRGVPLFDMVYLATDRKKMINEKSLASQFGSLEDIKLFAQQTDDAELRLACRLVDRYKGALIPLIFKVKELQAPRNKTNVIFSSAHRSKGAEYGHVTLADDFTNGKKVKKALKKANKSGDTPDYKNMAEAINVLYVAITRTMNTIDIPFDIEMGVPDKR